jgi:hypothetical protein
VVRAIEEVDGLRTSSLLGEVVSQIYFCNDGATWGRLLKWVNEFVGDLKIMPAGRHEWIIRKRDSERSLLKNLLVAQENYSKDLCSSVSLESRIRGAFSAAVRLPK